MEVTGQGGFAHTHSVQCWKVRTLTNTKHTLASISGAAMIKQGASMCYSTTLYIGIVEAHQCPREYIMEMGFFSQSLLQRLPNLFVMLLGKQKSQEVVHVEVSPVSKILHHIKLFFREFYSSGSLQASLPLVYLTKILHQISARTESLCIT